MSLEPGAKVDQYEILAPLGSGGMGEVFRAKDTRLNRNVAIKVLSGVSSSDPDRLRRFEQEAQAAAALNHPNILAVYEFGIHEGVPYLVSELLEGKTLRERLDAGSLSIRRVIDYGAQIARGLAAAHEKGIIHRDLKPDNLFLTKDGQVKILDFGLARISRERDEDNAGARTTADRTRPGMVMGTVGYMSPEQVRGQVVDHRSDIFSFASILYEMLTGKRAFRKPTNPETMAAILNEEPTSPAELAPNAPVALQRVVLRGLEKNPEQRFQSASDMAFALESLTDLAELSRTMIAQRPVAHRGWTRRVLFGAALAIVVCLGVLAYLWMRPVPVPRVANYVQLTHDGLQKSLIATDGSRIYMTLLNSGVQDVAAIPTSGGEQTKIRMPSPNMVPLDLSPDGLSLLVVDGKGVPSIGPLWSLPALGGSPRRLGNAIGDSARWSPDGNMLAYANGGDIFLAKADGTDPRKLAKMESLVTDLTWAPDGSHLRFDTSDFSLSAAAGTGVGQQAMWEIAADGSNPHKLLASWHNPPDECCGKWTADGRYFVFHSQEQIWALPERGGLFHPEPQPIQLTASPMALFSPLTSKDGKKLYVVGRSFRGELMRYDANSGKFVPELGGISGEYVSFSKDGRWAAYVAYPEATLWKCKADGTERQQLTFPPLRAALPRWSPDGASIVFFSFPEGPTKPARLYKISAAGGTPEELLPQDRRNHIDATWSADGKRLAFGEDYNDATITQGRPMIHILNLRTRELVDVAGSLGLYSPRWSPDGKYLAAMTADSSTVVLFDFKSQKWTQLAHGTFGWPEWSRDGRSIYVLDMSGKGAVARIRISDGKVEHLVDLKNFLNTGQAGGGLSLGPEDALILLRDTGTQDVYALDWNAP